jgi:hypothetical protein
MTDTITPPPFFTLDEVADQRADAEWEVYSAIAKKAVAYGIDSDYEYSEIRALLVALGIPEDCWPNTEEDRTYNVSFTATVEFEREVTISVNIFDDTDIEETLMETLCYEAEGDEAEGYIASVREITEYSETD